MKALALVALATLLATPAFADSMTKEAIDKVQLAKNHCAQVFPDNFEMREYCEDKQVQRATAVD